MANRSYFLNHPKNEPLGYSNRVYPQLLAANYQIPVLWLAMFSEASIKKIDVDMQSDDGKKSIQKVPTLFTFATEGLQIYANRRKIIEAIIPRNKAQHIKEWETFLSTEIKESSIQIELTEIWMMHEDGDYDDGIREYLRSFASTNPADWEAIVSQAELNDDENSRFGIRGAPWDVKGLNWS